MTEKEIEEREKEQERQKEREKAVMIYSKVSSKQVSKVEYLPCSLQKLCLSLCLGGSFGLPHSVRHQSRD